MKNKKHLLRILITLLVISIIVIAVKGLMPGSKASLPVTIDVLYKSGEGSGKDVTTSQKILNEQSNGSNDYTSRKIVLHKNGDTTTEGKSISFEGGTVEEQGKVYEKVLTGWKVTGVTKDGKKLTEFVKPENEDYANLNDASKDIGTVYAQNGWYTVPNGVTSLEVTAVYGRAIYIRSPYDKMYFDEYHIFESGKNALEDDVTEKSSDKNFGTSKEDAVSTLKRAYELVKEDASNTVYDTVFVLCGDLYEVNYNEAGSDFILDTAESYENYSSKFFGYNQNNYKPVTIASNGNVQYSLYLSAPEKELEIYSSLRFDNVCLKALTETDIKVIRGSEVSAKTYSHIVDLGFYSTGSFEVTETVSTDNKSINLFFRNLSRVKLCGGSWSPFVAKSEDEISTLSDKNIVIVGGVAKVENLTLQYENVLNKDKAIIQNPPTMIITGGVINKVSGVSEVGVKGNVNIFVSGGNIGELFGVDNQSVSASSKDKGNVNVKIYDGFVDKVYGKNGECDISGSVNLIIDSFRTNDDDARFKKIGQVDNWDNLILDNSYVILEDKSYEMTQVGNLSVSEGSGLKLSSDSKILGNFTGGGELYLDSDICLTIEGDISGTTKLILNPVLVNGSNVIKGGKDHPYIIVGGNSKTKAKLSDIATYSTGTELESEDVVSGEENYSIMSSGGEYSYYYLSDNVEISNYADIKSTNLVDRIYNENIGSKVGSLAENISILEIGDFTNVMTIDYEFYKDTDNPNKYANITREFVLKDSSGKCVSIPNGTEILMIYNEKNYIFVADSDKDSIDLSLFKGDDGLNFTQVKNLQKAEGVKEQRNEVTGNTLYNYSESFRFIVTFANIIENNGSIEPGIYYPMLNLKDNSTLIGDEQKENTNNVSISQVAFTPSSLKPEKDIYFGNENVEIFASGTVKTYNGDGKALYGNVKLYNESNKRVDIPNATKVKVNDGIYDVVNGSALVKFLDNCTDSGTSYDLSFSMDMTNVLKQNQLPAGTYKLVFEYCFAENGDVMGNIAGYSEASIVINDMDGKCGLDFSVGSVSGIPDDKVQIISKGKDETRMIWLSLEGSDNIEEPVAKFSVLEKIGEFDYAETSNSSKITIEGNMNFGTKTASETVDENSEANITDEIIENDEAKGTSRAKTRIKSFYLHFSETLPEGTYRIKVEMYDKYENLITENFVNFIVVDTPEL